MNDRRHLLVLVVLVLVVCAPMVRFGLPDWGNDSTFQALMTKDFATQWWGGEIYPRWLSGLNGGYGAASFFFYPSFSRFAVVWLEPVVGSWDASGFYLAGVSALLAMVFAAWAAYYWCRSFAEPEAALFGAVIYTIQPYHLAVDLYTRGALSEMWANVWPPLILLSVFRLARGSSLAFVGLSVSYGCLILNHLPTTVCFSIVPVVAAIYFAPAGRRIPAVLRAGMAMTLGIALAATYLAPAMLDQQKANLDWYRADPFFHYARWWLFQWQPLYDSRTRLMLLIVATLSFVLPCFWLAWRSERVADRRRQLLFQGGLLLYSLIMATKLSRPLWEALPTLRELQFPTRFLEVFMVAVAGIAALGWPYLRQRRARSLAFVSAVSILVWVAATVWAASMAFGEWRPFQAEERARRLRIRRSGCEHLPRTAPQQFCEDSAIERIQREYPPRVPMLETLQGRRLERPVVESWKPREIVLRLNAVEAGLLTVNHFYYADWTARVENSDKELRISATKPYGFIHVHVPAGTYRLYLTLRQAGPERVGNRISLASVAGLVLLSALLWRNRTGKCAGP